MNIIKPILLSIILCLVGCVSYYPVGPLSPPASFVEVPLNRSAQISDVMVSDKSMDEEERKEAQKKITLELEKYINRAGYFEKLVIFPSKLAEQDVVLKFEFSRLYSHRAPHPAYFPGAIMTCTLWIWFNGAIYVDSFELTGSLTIENAKGRVLAKSNSQIMTNHNVGLLDPEYSDVLVLGNRELGMLIKKLLDDATNQLKGMK